MTPVFILPVVGSLFNKTKIFTPFIPGFIDDQWKVITHPRKFGNYLKSTRLASPPPHPPRPFFVTVQSFFEVQKVSSNLCVFIICVSSVV